MNTTDVWVDGRVEYGELGMSLRDYFAGQAIQGVIVSVDYADALIKKLGL